MAKLQSVPVWIKASDDLPIEAGNYHVKIFEKDGDGYTFPAVCCFTLGMWEVAEDTYEVIEWLDESNTYYVLTEKEFQDYTERVAAEAWDASRRYSLFLRHGAAENAPPNKEVFIKDFK